MNKKVYAYITALTFFPQIAFAVTAPSTFKGLVYMILDVLGAITPILFAVALIVFLWGVGQFILKTEESGALELAKQKMFWGVIALFVLFSLWGIVRFLGDSFGISGFF